MNTTSSGASPNSTHVGKSPPMNALALQQKQRSFLTFGFSAGSGPSRRESHVNVNVTPTSHDVSSDTPEIRKYKKRFNSEILCAALWGKFNIEIYLSIWSLGIFSNYIIFCCYLY